MRSEINSPRARSIQASLLTGRKSQGLVLPLSVKENLCLASVDKFSSWGLMDTGEEQRAAGQYVKDLRIKTPGLSQKVVYLSGGNQQKVVLSKWLCCQSEVFIFDEPTRGVDVGAKPKSI